MAFNDLFPEGAGYRNEECGQVDPWREFIRNFMPDGKHGFVYEDLDGVIRQFGMHFRQDSTGRFMMIERKHMGYNLKEAQLRTFGLLDSVLRESNGSRYLGLFRVNVFMRPVYPVLVNGVEHLNDDDLQAFLAGEKLPPPYDFGKNKPQNQERTKCQ